MPVCLHGLDTGVSSSRPDSYSDCQQVTSYIKTFYQLHLLFVAKIRKWTTSLSGF